MFQGKRVSPRREGTGLICYGYGYGQCKSWSGETQCCWLITCLGDGPWRVLQSTLPSC